MATMKITLIGMINYFESLGDSLFKYLNLPSDYDKNTVIDTIILHGAEFPVIWANPEFVQRMIKPWCNKNYMMFEKWMQEYNAEFNPLHNYDRYEEWTDTGKEKEKVESTGESTTKNKVSAYDSNTMKDDSQIELDNTADSDRNKDNTNTHKGHLYGNIGVTTSTAMLAEAWDWYKSHNPIEAVADSFIKEFCILVY